MKIKKKKFLSLKQGNMSVSEYRDKFVQLCRYAPEEVVEDDRKQEQFLEGLIGPLQYQLMSHSFPSFQKLLYKAIAPEHKLQAITQGQGAAVVVLALLSLRVHQLVQEEGNSLISTLFRRRPGQTSDSMPSPSCPSWHPGKTC
jgi:hypothetical protein